MRGILILFLAAVTSAGKLGYDYRPGSGVGLLGAGSRLSGHGSEVSSSVGRGIGGGHGLSGGLSIGSGGGHSGVLGVGQVSGLSIGGHNIGSGTGHGLSLIGGVAGSGILTTGSGHSSGSHGSGILTGHSPVVTEYNKEFYFHSAPEEEFHDSGASHRVTNTLKKNLRVVFIKAPENNAHTNAALQIARQAVEDRTAIYVLTKQSDLSDLSNQLQEIKEIRSQKPEVRFIKYRTAQDALNAQRAIQAQYESLGGSSKSSNEGIAPVLNYASSGTVNHLHGSGSELLSAGSGLSGSIALASDGQHSSSLTTHSAPKNSYLPPISL